MSGYGHDVWHAKQRGHSRRAQEHLAEAMRHEGMRGGSKPTARFMFAMALTGLIQAAGRMGATAEEIRNAVERSLKRTDSLTIENYVERHAKQQDRPGDALGPVEFHGQGPCEACEGTSYQPKGKIVLVLDPEDAGCVQSALVSQALICDRGIERVSEYPAWVESKIAERDQSIRIGKQILDKRAEMNHE